MSNIISIQKAIWDSDFFGRKIGKLFLNNIEDLDAEELKQYDLVYVFSDNPDLNLKLVDKKIVYLIDDLQKVEQINLSEPEFYDPTTDDYSQLLDLTLQSGVFSRFNIDRNFTNNEYQRLYKEWIDKSITKEIALEIIIKKIDSKIVGFATVTHKSEGIADIGLVAVDDNHRGKGIAKEIISQILEFAKSRHYKKIQVVTQLDNSPANILYTKMGFKKESLTNVYHIWPYDTF